MVQFQLSRFSCSLKGKILYCEYRVYRSIPIKKMGIVKWYNIIM